MTSYRELQKAHIAASPQACFAALTDFESLPRWQRAVREVRVLERDEQGRGAVVEYVVDARFKTVTYRLRQIYDEPRRLGSEYLGGDFATSPASGASSRRRRRDLRRARPAHRSGLLRPGLPAARDR